MSPDLHVLPSVTQLLRHPEVLWLASRMPRELLVQFIREALAERRQQLQTEVPSSSAAAESSAVAELARLAERVRQRVRQHQALRLRRVINATGIVLHTGLGRAALSAAAVQSVTDCARAANVELDLLEGTRSVRGDSLRAAWQVLTGCEDALLVNNNAAATLLTLQALCAGREVIISRGQLIEIGGSFRLPEIFQLSGAILREVGTTNRTSLRDYAAAIGPATAAILRVHPSNYQVVGFAATPTIDELAPLARAHNLLLIDDIGSGCLQDLTRFGLPAEPTFGQSVAAGADVTLGSGDKLLGGPQCGIIVGRSSWLQQMKSHPLARAVRVDKLTLAALTATLDAYLQQQADTLPVFQLLTCDVASLQRRAAGICEQLSAADDWKLTVEQAETEIGGGSLPCARLETVVIAVQHQSAAAATLAHNLRTGPISVVPRIAHGRVLLDLRSIHADEDAQLVCALRELLRPQPS